MSKLGYFLGGAVAGALGLAALACVINTSPTPSGSGLGHAPDADEFAAAEANDGADNVDACAEGDADAPVDGGIDSAEACTA